MNAPFLREGEQTDQLIAVIRAFPVCPTRSTPTAGFCRLPLDELSEHAPADEEGKEVEEDERAVAEEEE